MTEDLVQMADWIIQKGCTHVAMESTGSCWKPIYNLLEMENLEVLIVNAKHIKNDPGRKTDVKDAEWTANLLQHGMLQGSFIPSREQRELARYRRSLIEERSREVNRIQKVLEGANIKLSSVAGDVPGKSSRFMIEAIVAGETDHEALSALALRKMKQKKDELKRASMVGLSCACIIYASSSRIHRKFGWRASRVRLFDGRPGMPAFFLGHFPYRCINAS